MSLTEFLLARITEEENHARAVLNSIPPQSRPLTWEWQAWSGNKQDPQPYQFPGVPTPTRVLAECEAKRRIVERHALCGSGHGYCDDGGHGIEGLGCGELLDLALPYADHPHVLPEWLDP